MKWAPNKKLHFEVAVIKAIQTLGQVTLTDVIENLTALRGGDAPTSPLSLGPKNRSRSAAKAGARGKESSRASKREACALPLRARFRGIAAQRRLPHSCRHAAGRHGRRSGRKRLSSPPRAVPCSEPGSTRRNCSEPKGTRCFARFRARTKDEHGIALAGQQPQPSSKHFLKELTGSDWTVKLSLVEGLPPPRRRSAPSEAETKVQA